jgi:hypothetical protein
MKEKFLPWFLLFCALGLSGTAAYYSVVGLSIVFVGVALPVIIMGSFLEVSKIAIATYLHDKWKETYGVLKIYLTIALVILSLITSLGIYGLLSTGFQGNIAKLEINEKQVKNVEVKKNRFEEVKDELTKEKTTLDGDITKLRDGLSNNTTTQSVDGRTGQIITRANNANRKSFETQLSQAQVRRDTIAKRIDNMNDSITKLDVDILNMESEEISGSELGALKYVSELLDWDIKRTANLFILILIFVFDPLAITLVIATNQAFKGKRKDEDTHQVTHQVEDNTPKEVTDQVPTKFRPSNGEVKKIWERVKKLQEEGKLPTPTQEDIDNEPTALAFTPYDTENNDVIEKEVEPISPTEEFLKKLEKVLDENYKTSENNNEEPITPTDEELKKLEELLSIKKDDNIDGIVEKEDEMTSNEPNPIETPQTKKLSYLNRDGYGKSLRISRI